MSTLKTEVLAEKQELNRERELNRELNSDELESVVGGAFQAHISIEGSKSGNLKG
jgi:hypothetical protein